MALLEIPQLHLSNLDVLTFLVCQVLFRDDMLVMGLVTRVIGVRPFLDKSLLEEVVREVVDALLLLDFVPFEQFEAILR